MACWELLKNLQPVAVATVDQLRPRVRPMTLICKQERLFLATGLRDAKVEQLKTQPYLELYLALKNEAGNGYLRISGKVEPVRQVQTKKEIADFAHFIYDYWEDPANEDYVLYELHAQEWRYLKPGEDLETLSF